MAETTEAGFPVWRRFGRCHPNPCKRPGVLACARWQCQQANGCRWDEAAGRPIALTEDVTND